MSDTSSNSIFRATKQSLADALLADPYFANIPVFVLIPKNILSQIAKGTYTLQGGLAIFVGAGSGRGQNDETPGPIFNQSSFSFELLQSPTITPATATYDIDEAGERAMTLLHLFAPNGDNRVFTVSDWAEMEDSVYSRRIFKVNGPLALGGTPLPPISTVTATPTTPGNQAVSLGCTTRGAAIYYTLGTPPDPIPYPSPRNGVLVSALEPLTDQSGNTLTDQSGKILYGGGAINVLAGQQLRARAWLAGYAPANPPDISNQY